jgi:hypothetical protein
MKELLLTLISGVAGYALRSLQDFINEKRRIIVEPQKASIGVSQLLGKVLLQFSFELLIKNNSSSQQSIWEPKIEVSYNGEYYTFPIMEITPSEAEKGYFNEDILNNNPFRQVYNIDNDAKTNKIYKYNWYIKYKLEKDVLLEGQYFLIYNSVNKVVRKKIIVQTKYEIPSLKSIE